MFYMINTFKEDDNESSIDNKLQNKDEYKLFSKVLIKNIKIILKMLFSIQIINMIHLYHHKLKRFFIIQILKKLLYHMLVLILDLKNGIMI